MISPANTNPVVTDRGYPNVNRVCGRDDVQGVVGSEFAHATMKAKTVSHHPRQDAVRSGRRRVLQGRRREEGPEDRRLRGHRGEVELRPDRHADEGEEPGRDLLRRHLRPGGAVLQTGPRERRQGQVLRSRRHGLVGSDEDRRQGRGRHVLHLGGWSRLGAPESQGLRRRVQEEVRQESRAVCGRGLRCGHDSPQGHRGGGEGRQGADARRRRDGRPQDQAAQRHHRRHRVRRQGRPQEGAVLRVAGRQRRSGELGLQQDRQAAGDRRACRPQSK